MTLLSGSFRKLFVKSMYRSFSNSKVLVPDVTKIPSLPGYLIKRMRRVDEDRVMDFFEKTFFVEEPINKSVDLINDLQSLQSTKEYYSDLIDSGVSIVVVDEKDNLISAMLNNVEYRHNRDKKTVHREGIALNKTLRMCDILKSKTNPFDIYPDLNTYVEMCAGSVDVHHRGKRILGSMITLIINTAKSADIKLLRMEASNAHSGRVAETFGFKTVHSIKYKDYKINNEIVFKTEPPHEDISIKFLIL